MIQIYIYVWPHTFLMTDLLLVFSRGRAQYSKLWGASMAHTKWEYVLTFGINQLSLKVKGSIYSHYIGYKLVCAYIYLYTSTYSLWFCLLLRRLEITYAVAPTTTPLNTTQQRMTGTRTDANKELLLSADKALSVGKDSVCT